MLPLLRLYQVSYWISGVNILDGITIDVDEGQRLAIIGTNGAGKTTLLNVICGFARQSSGTIYLGCSNISTWSADARARGGVVRVFQNTNLFASLTVFENVLLALRPVHKTDAALHSQIVIRNLGLTEVLQSPIATLPYYKRRALDIGIALARKPKLLILDEPFAGLSTTESESIVNLLSNVDPRTTVLIVDHSISLLTTITGRAITLHGGRVVFDGDWDRLVVAENSIGKI